MSVRQADCRLSGWQTPVRAPLRLPLHAGFCGRLVSWSTAWEQALVLLVLGTQKKGELKHKGTAGLPTQASWATARNLWAQNNSSKGWGRVFSQWQRNLALPSNDPPPSRIRQGETLSLMSLWLYYQLLYTIFNQLSSSIGAYSGEVFILQNYLYIFSGPVTNLTPLTSI